MGKDMKRCKSCNGTGQVGFPPKTCPQCDGWGVC